MLSVIIPVYNEAETIRQVIDKIIAVPVEKEIIAVDDSSTDGTDKILRDLRYDNLKVIYHSSNRGKGAAVLSGLEQALGEYVIVQDADLDYDPANYIKLMDAIQVGDKDLILGTRFNESYHGIKFPRAVDRFLTGLMNMLFGVKLSDCLSCYKLMRKADLIGLALGSNSFDIEILSKVIKRKMRILEVPVRYDPRSYKEDKKIRMRDGFWAVLRILYFRFS